MIRYLIFDLDNTLYPKSAGLMQAVDQRISEYMELRLKIDPSLIEGLKAEYHKRYGTATRGLCLHYDLDLQDYVSYVHCIEVEDYLAPDEHLEAVLSRLADFKKFIFSNSSRGYAERVLKALGIERYFDRIFDLYFMKFTSKPDPRPYRWMLEELKVTGEECVMIDDSLSNLLPAKELGMITVLLAAGKEPPEGADYVIEEIRQLEGVVRSLQRAIDKKKLM